LGKEGEGGCGRIVVEESLWVPSKKKKRRGAKNHGSSTKTKKGRREKEGARVLLIIGVLWKHRKSAKKIHKKFGMENECVGEAILRKLDCITAGCSRRRTGVPSCVCAKKKKT